MFGYVISMVWGWGYRSSTIMNALQSQKLWNSSRANRTRKKRRHTRSEGERLTDSEPRSERRLNFHAPTVSGCKPPPSSSSKSHFTKWNQKQGQGSLQSLSSHSAKTRSPTTADRAHTSLGFVRQGPTHQLHSQSSRQISSQGRTPHTSSHKSPRAHSSLGFSWQGPTHQLKAPQGFDIASYVQQQGTRSEIRIGVNGRESQDEYLLTYLRGCKKQGAGDHSEEEGVWSGEEDVDVIMMSSEKDMGLVKDVPLCWEDQLKKAEPNTVRNITPSGHNTYKVQSTLTRSRTKPGKAPPTPDSHKNQEAILHRLLAHASKVSVLVTWGCSTCLMESSSLEELKEGKITSIPQPTDLVAKEDTHNGWSQSDVTMATSSLCEGDQREDDVALTGSGRDCVSDLVQSFLRVSTDFDSKDLLCVWFGGVPVEIKELSSLDFDVFITGSSTQVFSKVKAVNTSDTRAVIPLRVERRDLLRDKTGGGERDLTLCVMCGYPRSILFTVRIKCPSPSSPLSRHDSEGPFSPVASLSEEEEEVDTAVVGGATSDQPGVRFFKRRSYVKPDEDEDKTDMKTLVKFFPDLMLLDLVDQETTPTILSPLHHHVERLSSMTTTPTSNEREPLSINSLMNIEALSVTKSNDKHPVKGKPLSLTVSIATSELHSSSSLTTQQTNEPSSTISMTTQLSSEPLSLPSNNCAPLSSHEQTPHKLQYTHSSEGAVTRPLYRPTRQEHQDSSGRLRKSFVSIAEQWLGQYDIV